MAKYHPNKEISKAIEYAISKGWRFETGGSHRYGFLFCPYAQRGGCRKGVDSTPRNAQNHANQLIRFVDSCPHQ